MRAANALRPEPQAPASRPQRRVRALVVHDDNAIRRLLLTLLSSDPEVEVVGEAGELEAATRLARAARPDVVALGAVDEDPLQWVAALMLDAPSPVVTLAPHDRGTAEFTVAALRAGAVAVVDFAVGPDELGQNLRAALKNVTSTEPSAFGRTPSQCSTLSRLTTGGRPRPEVLAVVASQGGMMALGALLGDLPAHFELPVLVVIHPTAGLVEVLADWLRDVTPFDVDIAREGEPLLPGKVYLAGEDAHLAVGPAGLAVVDRAPPVRGNRPSADRLFGSVAEAFGDRALALVLTGSHIDGLDGLEAIRAAGGQIVLQNAASSAGFELGEQVMGRALPDYVLPLPEIPGQLLRLVE